MHLNARMVMLSQGDWPCAALCNVFAPDVYQGIIDGLGQLEWSEATQHFYRQREVDLANISHYRSLFNERTRVQIADAVGTFFGLSVRSDFDIAAHKMIPGDCIGVHTDANSYGETHRLAVTLNDSWSVSDGGVLLVLEGTSLKSTSSAWLPSPNNGFLFEVSETSFHAVTPITGEEPRFSIILTFKSERNRTDNSQRWAPFVLEGDVDSAVATAAHMGIGGKTFAAGYDFVEFPSVADFSNYVGHLKNAPAGLSYRNGTSINVDQHGRQPRGSDAERTAAIGRLTCIPPIIVVKRASGEFCLVDGSHRLSHANDERTSVGVAFFDES